MSAETRGPANDAWLRRLRAAIDEESPVDEIHDPKVESLYRQGGECPRYLACTSEGHWDSAFRSNPDFQVGDAEHVARWLAASYEEGWAGRWVLDLDTGEQLGWTIKVNLTDGISPGSQEAVA